MDYYSYVERLAANGRLMQADVNLSTLVPAAIDYAEQRMYRELDLLATRVTSSGSLTANNRGFTLPTTSGTYLVVESVNAISPAGIGSSIGTRNPLTMVAREFIDAVYPINNTATSGVPAFCAMASNTAMIVGPPPDGAYVLEVIGTQRPTALSSANTSTILTSMLPDAFLAASMVYVGKGQQDGGAAWEEEYQKLIASATVEELRKKYQSQGWTDKAPSPLATPPRA